MWFRRMNTPVKLWPVPVVRKQSKAGSMQYTTLYHQCAAANAGCHIHGSKCWRLPPTKLRGYATSDAWTSRGGNRCPTAPLVRAFPPVPVPGPSPSAPAPYGGVPRKAPPCHVWAAPKRCKSTIPFAATNGTPTRSA